MKKLLTLITLSVLLVSGCGDDEPAGSQGGGAIGSVTGLSGNIMNLPDPSDLNIAFTLPVHDPELRSSSSINPEGRFSISELPTPEDRMFINNLFPRFAPEVEFIENNLVCSDMSARTCFSTLHILRDSLNTLGYVSRQNYSDMSLTTEAMYRTGNFTTDYIYVSRDVILKGKLVYIFASPEFDFESHITMTYDISYRKGWNKKVKYIKHWDTQVRNGKKIYTGTIQYLDREPGPAYFYCSMQSHASAKKGQDNTKPQYRINPIGIERP